MTARRPTSTDVAQRAGVSKATVSAVLNDTGPVRDATRERVLAAVESLNYRPSPAAGRGTARRHRCLALLIKEHDNPYYAGVLAGVRAVAAPRGYAVVVLSSEGEGAAERRAVELVRAIDVDGLIATPVMDAGADLSHFFELKRRNFPFVLLEAVRGVPASLVDVDNVEASRLAVAHLIGLGHTRIAHLAGPPYSMHSQERVDGVRRAFSASRLAFHPEDVVAAGAHLADGHRAALALFGARAPAERPTAISCYNDLVAIGACQALRSLGLRVPDDVSVVGFDDLPLLAYLDVPLTTVRVPIGDMGARAAELLVRHVEARQTLPPRKLVLDATLVVRASTRAVGAATDARPAAPARPTASSRRPTARPAAHARRP